PGASPAPRRTGLFRGGHRAHATGRPRRRRRRPADPREPAAASRGPGAAGPTRRNGTNPGRTRGRGRDRRPLCAPAAGVVGRGGAGGGAPGPCSGGSGRGGRWFRRATGDHRRPGFLDERPRGVLTVLRRPRRRDGPAVPPAWPASATGLLGRRGGGPRRSPARSGRGRRGVVVGGAPGDRPRAGPVRPSRPAPRVRG